MVQRSIVWFKTDLRLHDNETLIRALEKSHEIIPVYCFDDAHFATTEYGFKKTGNFRAQFILESVADLDASLRLLGSGLVVLRGKPETELLKIARELNVQKIFAKKEVAYEEIKKEEEVERALWKLSCTLETFSTSTLYHAQDLPFSIKNIPDVFTTFRKKVEKESTIRGIYHKPFSISSPAIPSLQLPTPAQLGFNTSLSVPRSAISFKGGETEALKRLHYYLFESQAIATYKETRDEMIGKDYSTKLSPYLALGCLSPREIYQEIKNYETEFSASKSSYWIVFELLWRDYFRFMMKKYREKFFQQKGIKNNRPGQSAHNEEQLIKWTNGQTGNDFIDANMMELNKTGYMSNRGRQNVASYFCNDLQLDWRYGAAYFEQQLVDYDVCSNWGNWAYLAGFGNDPRGKRYFNIEKQASDYDPKKLYRKMWLKKT